jgi:hypothetical protein
MIGNLVIDDANFAGKSVLDIQNLTNGIYFVDVEFNDGSYKNTKLIKR